MRTAAKMLFCLALIGAAAGSQAQLRYSCTANGVSYMSPSPCPSTTTPTYYGPPPAERQNTYTQPAPRVESAPPQAQYLSGRCNSLGDALRTAQTRGLKPETIETMRRSYEDQCREEEQQAREKLYNEKFSKVKQRKEEDVENKRAQDRSALQIQQCGESKRILNSKRARTDLTEGEKGDLARFEENYKSRCG